RRGKEPEFVLFYWSTDCCVDIAVKTNLVDGADSIRFQKTGQIVALQGRTLIASKKRAMKLIAAFLGSDHDPKTLRGRIRNSSAGLIDHFLVSSIVLVTLNGAVALQTVDDHSIVQNRRLCSTGAVHIEVGLLHGLRATDVRCR